MTKKVLTRPKFRWDSSAVRRGGDRDFFYEEEKGKKNREIYSSPRLEKRRIFLFHVLVFREEGKESCRPSYTSDEKGEDLAAESQGKESFYFLPGLAFTSREEKEGGEEGGSYYLPPDPEGRRNLLTCSATDMAHSYLLGNKKKKSGERL